VIHVFSTSHCPTDQICTKYSKAQGGCLHVKNTRHTDSCYWMLWNYSYTFNWWLDTYAHINVLQAAALPWHYVLFTITAMITTAHSMMMV